MQFEVDLDEEGPKKVDLHSLKNVKPEGEAISNLEASQVSQLRRKKKKKKKKKMSNF